MEGAVGGTAGLRIANDRTVIAPLVKAAFKGHRAIGTGLNRLMGDGDVIFVVTRFPAAVLIEPIVIAVFADPFDLQGMIDQRIAIGINHQRIKFGRLPI